MADQDGLSWVLDLETKLGGAVEMVRQLKNIQGALQGADAAMDRAEKHGGSALSRLAHRTNEWWREFGSAAAASFTGHFGAEAVWDSIKEGAHLVVELTRETLAAADAERKLEISFDYLIGTARREVTFEWLDRLAKQLPGTDDDMKGLARTLLSVGVAEKDLRATMVGASDLAVITGQNPQEIAQAFGEVMRRGEINERILRSLKMTEKDALAPLAAALHISTEAVKERMAAGQIKGADSLRSLLQALANRTGGELGGASVEAGSTLLETVKDLQNAGEDLLKGFVMKFGPAVAKGLGALVEALGPEGELGGALGGLLDELGTGLAGIDWVGGARALIDVMGQAVGIAKELAGLIGGALDKALKVTDSLGITDSEGKFLRDDPEVRALNERNLQLSMRRINQFHGARPIAAALQETATSGLQEGAAARGGGAHEAGRAIGEAAIAGAKEALDAHSPSRKFAELGEYSADGYVEGLRAGGGEIGRAIRDTVSIPAPGTYAPAARGVGGSVSVSMPIEIRVEGRDGDQIGDTIAEKLRAILPGTIQSALEQVRVEVGA